jgi:hypothetical protein
MTALRIFVAFIFIVLAGYTVIVGANHGWDLFSVFFGDMALMGWAGQFNLDFMFMLSLSALWVSWRHEFSGAGLLLGVLAFFGGAAFLSVYLFIVAGQANGNAKELLLGKARA